MGYFLPITLTFVLPMAALFAAALVYGRLASDNELDACKASGVSLLTLVYPGLALAVMVAVANLFLSFDVTPTFVHGAEKSLKADAKKILFRNIQRKGYYKVPDGRYLVYADYADSQNDTLLGVVVTKTKDDRIEEITAVTSAKVKFNLHDGLNEVQITAYKPSQMRAEDEVWFDSELVSFKIQFGSLLGDEIKFKKVDEMKRIQSDLMRFDPVAKLARQTYAQLTAELLAQDIANRISNDTNSLYRLHSAEKIVEFRATECVAGDENNVKLSGQVVLTEYDATSKERLRTLRPTDASLHVEGDELAPTLAMDMYNARVEGSGELRMRYIIRGLIPPRTVTDKFQNANTLQNITPQAVSSALPNGPSPRLKGLQDKLEIKLRKTFAEIGAEIHSRLVFALGCVPMILIGMALGIIKRGGHLLSAFGASCVPAAVLVVCIISGKHLTENLGSEAVSGLVLMWAGLVFLLLLAAVIYHKLLRY